MNLYKHDLPEWTHTPDWWKTFVHQVQSKQDVESGRVLYDAVVRELQNWNIQYTSGCLVCDNPDTFTQFVLAYS